MTTTTAAERLDAYVAGYFSQEAARQEIDEIIQLAVATGDEETEHRAKLCLVTLSNMIGDIDARLSAFAWCLAKHQEDPVRFPSEFDGSDLFWQYKWMPGTLAGLPDFPLSTIEAVLDDMEQQYQRAGHGLSGIYSARYGVASRIGDEAAADRYLKAVMATPRDEYSHCEACTISTEALHYAERGDHARAVKLAEEMFEEGYVCGEEPEATQASIALSYLHLGRLETAVEMFDRSYAASRRDPDRLSTITDHIDFCVETGNLARGLALIERHLPWVGHDPLSRNEHFWALLQIGRLLEALSAEDRGDIAVHNSDHPGLDQYLGERAEPLSVRTFADRIWEAVEPIAVAFDTRNGTPKYSDGLASARTDFAARFPVQFADSLPEPLVVATGAGETPSEALARAYSLSMLGDQRTAIEVLTPVISELEGAEREEAAAILEFIASLRDEAGEAARWHSERVAALRSAGLDEEADLVEAIGVPDGTEEGSRAFADRVLAARARGASSDHLRALIEQRLVLALVDVDQFEQAREALATALQFAPAARRHVREQIIIVEPQFANAVGDHEWFADAVDRALASELSPGARARTLTQAARGAGGRGEFARGAQFADEAASIAAALGSRGAVVSSTCLAAALLSDAGQTDAAVMRMRYALAHAAQAGEVPPSVRSQLIDVLLAAEDGAEAATHIAENLALLDLSDEVLAEHPEPHEALDDLATAWQQMVRAQFQIGDADATYVAATRAFETRQRQGRPDNVAPAVLAFARVLMELGRHDEVVSTLDEWIPFLDTLEHPEAGVRGRAIRADALAYDENEGASAAYEEAQRLALEAELIALGADIQDSLGRAFMSRDQLDDAAKWLLTASENARSVNEHEMAARSELFAAYWLAEADRDAEATAIAVALYDWVKVDAPELLPNVVGTILGILNETDAGVDAARIRGELDM